MNIVIEGCDGTGKSTLAKYLCNQLGLYYWHENAPRTLEEYKQMLAPGGTVFDRFCLGQFIYNSPEERKLSQEDLQELFQYFKKSNTILLFVDAPTNVIIDRMLSRGEGTQELKYDMEKWIKNIRGAYRGLLKDVGAEYIEINGEKGVYHDTSN